MAAYNLTLVKAFLNYPEEFWIFISSRIIYVDSTIPGNEIFYNTFMKFDSQNKLQDIKVMIPSIIDLNTALITTHELKHAYDLYLRLGQEIDEEHESFEEDAIAVEKEFVKKNSDIKHNI